MCHASIAGPTMETTKAESFIPGAKKSAESKGKVTRRHTELGSGSISPPKPYFSAMDAESSSA
jgi:hypothetical protein